MPNPSTERAVLARIYRLAIGSLSDAVVRDQIISDCEVAIAAVDADDGCGECGRNTWNCECWRLDPVSPDV